MEEMQQLKKARKQLFLLGLFKIPMVGYVRPRLETLNQERAVINIKLRRRTRNHLNSMYFGAMSIGADLAAGLHTYYFAGENQKRMSFVFKSVNAEFVRRAESQVSFISEDGVKIRKAIEVALASKERVNANVSVVAKDTEGETVAIFEMVISVKFK